jgi:hypothetical protein
MRLILLILIGILIIGAGQGVQIQPYQINTDQPWNSQLHGVLNGSSEDDATTKAQVDTNDSILQAQITAIKASLTTGDNLTMTSSTPSLIHVGNAYSDQMIVLPDPAGNVSTIYTVSFDTFSAYRVYVNASPGELTTNLSTVCGDAYQFLSNGTIWSAIQWRMAPN